MFDQRATGEEYLDAPDCDPVLAADSYGFMEIVNRYFGGISAAKRFLNQVASSTETKAPIRLLDIGSGSCDIPMAVSKWAEKRNIPLQITCLEIPGPAMEIARRKLCELNNPNVSLLEGDIFTHHPAEPYDCAMASMCFHHFSDDQIISLVRRLQTIIRKSLLINDLRRSRMADVGARLLLAVMRSSPGVRHDALLSIKRGFTPDELNSLLQNIDMTNVSVHTAPWFRIAAVIQFQSGETF